MIESTKTKVESIDELINHLNMGRANAMEAIHIKTGDSYYIGFQFYWGSQTDLAYLTFINKNTHEIDFTDEDFDEDRFEEVSDNWLIFVG